MMKNGFFAAVLVFLVPTIGTFAQAPPPDLIPCFPTDTITDDCASDGPCTGDLQGNHCCPCPNSYRIWGGAEYLLWWVKDAPLPVPVVTTTTHPEILEPGGIGQLGTSTLYGGSPVNLGTFSGTRAILGGWLDEGQRVGIEGNGFLLEQRSAFFNVRSDANGNPFLGFPIYDPVALSTSAVPVSYPAVPPPLYSAGAITVASATRLWGSEANGLFNVFRNNSLEFDLLGGFRYLDLQESLTLSGNGTVYDPTTGDSAQTIGVDSFGTRNQFYGGQIGGRFGWNGRNLWLNATATVALGETHQSLTTYGLTQVLSATGEFAGIAPPTSLGSVYTQPTNIGHFSANTFTAVPAVQLKAGYAFTSRVAAYVGYDFLYWENVVRPGNQVDPTVNTSQRFGFPLVGPAAPLPQFVRSGFWAQGISFGVRFAF